MRWSARLNSIPSAARSLAFWLVTLACLTACSSTTQGATDAVVPPGPAAGEETVTLKVMSFNLFYGAGVYREYDEHIQPRFQGKNRMPQLLSLLDQVRPDVLAVEEAAGWDRGTADEVGKRLGMTHVIALDEWELHVIVFSKYPIVSAEAVSRFQGFNGVLLRTTLQVTPAAQVNFIAVHLNSMSQATRSCQVEALLDVAKGLTGRTILVGDMNFRPNSAQAQTLMSNGWQLIEAQEKWPIDEVWADPLAHATKSDWWSQFPSPDDISDHFPVGAEITLSLPKSQPGAAPEGRLVPSTMNYSCAIPTPTPRP